MYSLSRNVMRLSASLHNGKPNQEGLQVLLWETPRHFSSESEEPKKEPSIDPFLQRSSSGITFGRLVGSPRNTIKTDIINLLEGCNLTPQDIKFEYNRAYSPTSVMVQFPSRAVFDSAIRSIGRKGRLYRLDKADRSQWDLLTAYDGKVALLQGLPRNALPEDVERFLSGCDFDASSLQMFVRPAFPDPIRLALVNFPSQTQAMHAALVKNRSFCLNNQVTVRVLQ
ncbi:uncharacterized protein LOC122649084 isoform X2 [Telopea speciosissima]|uniref:uncharacterized protein LOC122649084 isoform X2 n=1 Tax=Telopea speciosissima TaxID=54955 RepID=UPI001CC4FD3F|nr:uncharacterized protein LOC122649084 isoform X2 [Telopea speciosissima]